MKSISELTTLSLEELRRMLEETRQELFHARAKVRAGEMKNLASIRQLKITIARILTVIKQKQNATNGENRIS